MTEQLQATCLVAVTCPRWAYRQGRGDRSGLASELDSKNGTQTAMCSSHQVAIGYIANNSLAALRFHDLRHSYATWLVTEGLPVNVVRKVLGHEQASTTLDIYTHTPDDYERRVIDALSADAFLLPSAQDEAGEENESDVGHML